MRIPYKPCKECGARHLQTSKISHRANGYCTEECAIHEPRGKVSADSIGWSDHIPAPWQKKQLRNITGMSAERPAGFWNFDLVHYPKPIGWVINWSYKTRSQHHDANH
jgi:hypothetical protein